MFPSFLVVCKIAHNESFKYILSTRIRTETFVFSRVLLLNCRLLSFFCCFSNDFCEEEDGDDEEMNDKLLFGVVVGVVVDVDEDEDNDVRYVPQTSHFRRRLEFNNVQI